MTAIRYLNQKDAIVLQRLAEHQSNLGAAELAEKLDDILSSAVLVQGDVRKKNCVGLNSKVTFSKTADGEVSTNAMTIVSPEDASAAESRISILAPLAMALIGRKVNGLVKVQLPYGEATLKILEVEHLENTEA
tara:strand:- start:102441 stop:102842 length:402 start_codon:yes stop_codon:yes gene_type:complete